MPKDGAGWRVGETTLALRVGDITHETTDAIMNAANPSLCGGGGVDGGRCDPSGWRPKPSLRVRGLRSPGARAPRSGEGDVDSRRETQGTLRHPHGRSDLQDQSHSAPTLESAYTESLRLAEELGLGSISFPSISTGAYGYPVDQAAPVALGAIVRHLRKGSCLHLVRVVCLSEETFSAFERARNALRDGQRAN